MVAQSRNWQTFFFEALVIVGSILLAFAIDAWWQEREERRIETTLLNNLRSDIRASQTHLEQWLAGNTRVYEASSRLLQQISNAERDSEISVPFRLVVGVLGTPTYSPTESTVRAAISSGQIELIEKPELRQALALWQSQLEDTREDELYRRDIVRTQLLPVLSSQTRLASAFAEHVDFFLQDSVTEPDKPVLLRASSDLEGALSHFVFFSNFIVDQLQDTGETQLQILDLLENR